MYLYPEYADYFTRHIHFDISALALNWSIPSSVLSMQRVRVDRSRASVCHFLHVYSARRNLKTTVNCYEPAWNMLSLHDIVGGSVDTKSSGVKRISALRDFPGVRTRFHTLFSQDPMHDYAEGVLAWFVQATFKKFHVDAVHQDAAKARLANARRGVCASLRWPNPTDDEISGESYHFNGASRLLVSIFHLYISCLDLNASLI